MAREKDDSVVQEPEAYLSPITLKDGTWVFGWLDAVPEMRWKRLFLGGREKVEFTCYPQFPPLRVNLTFLSAKQ